MDTDAITAWTQTIIFLTIFKVQMCAKIIKILYERHLCFQSRKKQTKKKLPVYLVGYPDNVRLGPNWQLPSTGCWSRVCDVFSVEVEHDASILNFFFQSVDSWSVRYSTSWEDSSKLSSNLGHQIFLACVGNFQLVEELPFFDIILAHLCL